MTPQTIHLTGEILLAGLCLVCWLALVVALFVIEELRARLAEIMRQRMLILPADPDFWSAAPKNRPRNPPC
jgi:hypothetical protein